MIKAQDTLPLDMIQVQIGDLLDRETLMHGNYPGERRWYRNELLRQRIRYYRKWAKKNVKRKKKSPRGPINPGHKKAIRAYMHVIDTAYEVRVSGIDFVTSQNENSVANQCYIGRGGHGGGGSDVHCKVIFLAELEDQYHDSGKINQVAVNVTTFRWPQHRILAAKEALLKKIAA